MRCRAPRRPCRSDLGRADALPNSSRSTADMSETRGVVRFRGRYAIPSSGLGSSAASSKRTSPVGLLCVSTSRTSSGKLFGRSYSCVRRSERRAERAGEFMLDEPISQRAECAGPPHGRHGDLERGVRCRSTRLRNEAFAPRRPKRSRSSRQIVRNAPAPMHVAQASKRDGRDLASLADQCRTKGVLTSRRTGQARAVIHVSAWRA
jgi:hypothetical protein